ncbi:MAG: helix-turn-helix domain-containing protein [Bacillota bacterium]
MDLHIELKLYRKDVLKLTQKEAAIRFNITQSTLSNYENGIKDIPYQCSLPLKKSITSLPMR